MPKQIPDPNLTSEQREAVLAELTHWRVGQKAENWVMISRIINRRLNLDLTSPQCRMLWAKYGPKHKP